MSSFFSQVGPFKRLIVPVGVSAALLALGAMWVHRPDPSATPEATAVDLKSVSNETKAIKLFLGCSKLVHDGPYLECERPSEEIAVRGPAASYTKGMAQRLGAEMNMAQCQWAGGLFDTVVCEHPKTSKPFIEFAPSFSPVLEGLTGACQANATATSATCERLGEVKTMEPVLVALVDLLGEMVRQQNKHIKRID